VPSQQDSDRILSNETPGTPDVNEAERRVDAERDR